MAVLFNHRRIVTQYGTPESTDVGGTLYFAHQTLVLSSHIGRVIRAIFLNGVCGYCEVESPVGFHFENGGTDRPFSVGFWVRAVGHGRVLALQYGAADTEWEVYARKDRRWIVRLYGGTDIEIGVRATQSTEDAHAWAFVAFTYGALGVTSSIRMYRNGRPLETEPVTAGTYSAMRTVAQSVLKIGRRKHTDMTGTIGEIAIWDSVLTPETLRDLYGAGKPRDLLNAPGADSLSAWWRVRPDDYPVLHDEKETNHGTIVNTKKSAIVVSKR